ncbi:MAG: hypothetical protein K8W52_36285 [Deltaproteobacteria bacterium]|nr:hypothetical protein [Deltaproteobacteria bacterium]
MQTVSSELEVPSIVRVDPIAPELATGNSAIEPDATAPSEVVVVDGHAMSIDEYIDQELTPLFAAEPIPGAAGDAAIEHGDLGVGRERYPVSLSREHTARASDARRPPDIRRGSTVQFARATIPSRILAPLRHAWRRLADAVRGHAARSANQR